MASGSKGIWQTAYGGNSSLKTCFSFIPAKTKIPQLWLKHYSLSQKERLEYHGEYKLNLKRRNFGMKFLFILHYLVRSCTTLLLQDHCSSPNADVSLTIQPSVNVDTYVVFYILPN